MVRQPRFCHSQGVGGLVCRVDTDRLGQEEVGSVPAVSCRECVMLWVSVKEQRQQASGMRLAGRAG